MAERMTDLDLAGIKARAEDIGKEVWSRDTNKPTRVYSGPDIVADPDFYSPSRNEKYAAFLLAVCPANVLALVAEVERLRFDHEHDEGSFARLIRTCDRAQNERDETKTEVERLQEQIKGWKWVACTAALALEPLCMSGFDKKHCIEVQAAIRIAVTAIRLAIGNGHLPTKMDADELEEYYRKRIAETA